jgi:putative membrane protein insertion efficiency factor
VIATTAHRIAGLADRAAGVLLRAGLRAYQLAISPLLGAHCRFEPSCSSYAREAIARHGAVSGLALGARRIARCHPFHPGGFDPVPATTREQGDRLGRRSP